ncbi:MAG: DUF2207 family protein [Candidatus Woesearchaeota archaeon]
MNTWRFIFIGIVVMFFFSTPFLPNLSFSTGRSYAILSGDVDIIIQESGKGFVTETYVYEFNGCYREVYRDYDLGSFRVSNIQGTASQEHTFHDRRYEWAINFGEICDTTVEVVYTFEIENLLRRSSDGSAILEYMLRGKTWDARFESFRATITYPESLSEIYINPVLFEDSYSVSNNVVSVSIDGPVRDFVEIRSIGGLSELSSLESAPVSAGILRQQQEDYRKEYMFSQYSVIALYLLYALFLALFIRAFGIIKNKTASYPLFFRDFPKRKPYLVNYLYRAPFGSLSLEAISATLLDLARRGYIHIEDHRKSFGRVDTTMTFVKDPSDLDDFEREVFIIYKKYAKDGVFTFSKNMYNRNLYRDVSSLTLKFTKEFKKKHVKFVTYPTMLASFGFLVIFVSGIIWFVSFGSIAPVLLAPLVILVMVLSLVSLVLPSVFPQKIALFKESYLQEAGEVFGYRKFITDLTLLKQYPPKSVILWDEHLVFATALGVAAKVEKHMKVVSPDANTRMYSAAAFSRSVATVSAPSSSGGSGGGSVGGSGGGGGGGAR